MCLIKSIQFCGKEILTAKKENQVYVGVKSICENIGVDYEAQYKRIQRDEVLNEAISIMETPTNSGIQKTNFLPLEYLNGFLFGISLNRVANEKTKQLLVAYKKECYKVLANHFLGLNTQIQTPAEPTPQEKLNQAIDALKIKTAKRIEEVGYTYSNSMYMTIEIIKNSLEVLKACNENAIKLPEEKMNLLRIS